MGRSPTVRPAGPGARPGSSSALRILYPPYGGHFLLDPGRPPAQQRPPLRPLPAGAPVRWTIDGVAAEAWVPTVGKHLLEAVAGTVHRQEEIDFD
ncbi:MAG TPA: hypothetical protein VH853_12945 [Polyangia bacterium]|nr:hypothetical protein [Polyangia bacterium]